MTTYRDILKRNWPRLPIIKFNDNTYEGIVWHPSFAHPTKVELDAAIAKASEVGRTLTNEQGLSLSFTLPDSGVLAGTYSKVQVDTMGRVVVGSKITALDIQDALGFMPTNHANLVNFTAAYSGSTGIMSGTSVIPADNTIPLITEGTQIWQQAIVPSSAEARFLIAQNFMLDCSTNSRQITLALFRNNVCVYATSVNVAQSGKTTSAFVQAIDAPATSAQVIYSLRVGVNSSTTWYVNTSAGNTITFGGVANSSNWSILELA